MAIKNGLAIYIMDTNSPWDNIKGKIYTVDRMVNKIMEDDYKLSLENVVSRIVNAHNIQINRREISPRQLMFGKEEGQSWPQTHILLPHGLRQTRTTPCEEKPLTNKAQEKSIKVCTGATG